MKHRGSIQVWMLLIGSAFTRAKDPTHVSAVSNPFGVVWWRFSSREGFSGPKCMLVCAAGQEQERVSSLAWSGFQDIMIQKHWEQPQTMMSEYQTTAAAVRQFFFRTNHNRDSYSNCSSCPTLHVERTECSHRISSLLGSCLDP